MSTDSPSTTEPTAPVDACSIAGPNGTRIPTEEPHVWVSRKGPDNVWVRTCQLCPAIDWDDLREGMLAFAAGFKETAEDLNTAPDVQGNVNGSTTDRLAAIREALADWMEHDDCDALLASDSALLELLNELEAKRAEVKRLHGLLSHAAELIWAALGHAPTFEGHEEARTFDSAWSYLGRAVKGLSDGEARLDARLTETQERLDTAEGRLAKVEQECDDLAIQRNHLKNRLEDLGVIVDDED